MTISVYFADLGAPWKKGGVEKHNQIYRRFLPRKKTILMPYLRSLTLKRLSK